jgi:hypothetical protein
MDINSNRPNPQFQEENSKFSLIVFLALLLGIPIGGILMNLLNK